MNIQRLKYLAHIRAHTMHIALSAILRSFRASADGFTKTPRAYKLLFAFILVSFSISAQSQEFDVLLKGGHVIDPKNQIDSRMDIAITGTKIVRVASNIPVQSAKSVIDLSGMYVAPGFIDIHAHVFWGTNGDRFNDGSFAVQPDGYTFRSGVTTIVDAGSMGWRTFPTFKKQTIDQSKTRVLAFLNIAGSGMRLMYESDVNDMDARLTAESAVLNKDYVVGVKTAHFRNRGLIAIDRAIEAAKLAEIPAMIHFADINPPATPYSLEDLFVNRLRPGDIFTHTYSTDFRREHIVNKSGKVSPYVFDAQKKGIVFDVGFGAGSLYFSQLIPSFKQGFLPNTISTDMYASSANGGMKDMSNVMSLFLSLGTSVKDVILRSTWNSALAIKRPELGNLSVGTEADIAVFRIEDGDFGFMDSSGKKFNGKKKIVNELTLRAGRTVWNLNGLGAKMWDVDVKY